MVRKCSTIWLNIFSHCEKILILRKIFSKEFFMKCIRVMKKFTCGEDYHNEHDRKRELESHGY